jgi:hypothetical protein
MKFTQQKIEWLEKLLYYRDFAPLAIRFLPKLVEINTCHLFLPEMIPKLKISVKVGILYGYSWVSMGTKVELKISIFLPEMIPNWKFQWKLVYCVGTNGYLWELKWNGNFQFFCQKWFQTENFSES